MVGLYIHWPFCVQKCHYCDLNSHVRDQIKYSNFVNGICDELKYWQSRIPSMDISTIFFGGGTPSLMEPAWVEQIFSTIRNSTWSCDPSEITMEVNPSTAEANKLKDFHNLGVNRISFGMQSFDDAILKSLGRMHSAAEGYDAILKGMSLYNNVSVDFMYGLPNQQLRHIEQALDKIIELQLKHVSWYALTIEQNTLFGQLFKRNQLRLPHDDKVCDMYDQISNRLSDNKMIQYEISNFALPGFESKHNMTYWRYEDFLGIGPGSHSRLTFNDKKHEIANYKLPEKWLESVDKNGNGIEIEAELSQDTQNQEEILMKLRTIEGLSIEDVNRLIPNGRSRIEKLLLTGDLTETFGNIHLTQAGFLKYNSILRFLGGM